MPRNTAVFEPTFKGTGVVRSDDITADPRYGRNAPYHGMPPGHLPVRSYLAVPVKGRSGSTIGGLFFGHSEVGRFTEHHERLAVGIASWAAVALENASLYASVQDASRLKDDFLASLSHELRTPLNAILGYARMLRTGMVPPDKQQKALETIERNVTSLTQIVEDVLDVSRIVSGKIRLNVQPVDLPAGRARRDRLDRAGRRRQGRARRDRARSERRADLRRSGAAAAGAVEPAVERREVHEPRRQGAGAARARQLARRGRRSATPASASRRSSCRTCSSGSGRPTPASRASAADSASGCRSRGSWSKCTAARSRPRAAASGTGRHVPRQAAADDRAPGARRASALRAARDAAARRRLPPAIFATFTSSPSTTSATRWRSWPTCWRRPAPASRTVAVGA